MSISAASEALSFGLIGRPLRHSFSPGYFNAFFERMGLPYRYGLFELAHIDELPQLLMDQPQLLGLNVTAPYKQAVLSYADELSEEVLPLGAANVLKIRRDTLGRASLKAYNTDVQGFRRSLLSFLGEERPTALLFGAGGAAAAVGFVLDELGISYRQVSRRGPLTYEALAEGATPEQLWINATSVGLHPEERLNLPYEHLSPRHWCYDLIYNPSQTHFLYQATLRGARTMNGLAMLHSQADAAWQIWTSDAP